MIKGNLNSVLMEGTVSEVYDTHFIIDHFENGMNEKGKKITIVNKFEILTPFGRKYVVEKGMNVRAVGSLRYHVNDRRPSIVPEHVDVTR